MQQARALLTAQRNYDNANRIFVNMNKIKDEFQEMQNKEERLRQAGEEKNMGKARRKITVEEELDWMVRFHDLKEECDYKRSELQVSLRFVLPISLTIYLENPPSRASRAQ